MACPPNRTCGPTVDEAYVMHAILYTVISVGLSSSACTLTGTVEMMFRGLMIDNQRHGCDSAAILEFMPARRPATCNRRWVFLADRGTSSATYLGRPLRRCSRPSEYRIDGSTRSPPIATRWCEWCAFTSPCRLYAVDVVIYDVMARSARPGSRPSASCRRRIGQKAVRREASMTCSN